jgi:hypothetical protein
MWGLLSAVFGPFSLGDSLRLYRLQRRGYSLDLVRSLTESQQPLWQAWLALMSQHAMGQPAYVLFDPHDGEAFIQVEYRPHQAAADVTYVAPALAGQCRKANAWSALLEGISLEMAVRGIERLFAGLPDSGPEVEAFYQAGFAPYAGEEILRLAHPPAHPSRELKEPARPQRPADLPALQKLCAAVIPQRVRQAEGGITLAPDKGSNCQRFVLPGENREELAGMLTISSGPSGHWMRLFVHPDARHLARDLVDFGLSALASQPPRPVFANVRKYESAIRTQLEEVGFELKAERVLLVRQTAACAKVPAAELAPALAGGARPVPPTYPMTGEPEGQPANAWLQQSADRDASRSF